MATKDELGRAGETRAERHLRDAGYEILDRNWRCSEGEIDIVAARDGLLAIVEVKTRRSVAYGHPFEAVDARKLRRLWRLAHAWSAAHPDIARGRELTVEAIGIVGADPERGAVEHLRNLA